MNCALHAGAMLQLAPVCLFHTEWSVKREESASQPDRQKASASMERQANLAGGQQAFRDIFVPDVV